ncbi:UDP-glucuronic acid decarboxylase family protein [Pseudosulfitobacter koreensis]|uniref:SDR family oxidoreductase n=1 Tax=Pseudosulfitobacter koreensis TaxID=2968472 RepID=A0ABT1YWZ9_9RHOB|nr:UDP-glucuronic acid decarboxylase family protein [Pseudosulfitobacter koreense]MCR8825415.1 SDR family oxidoreductase [Pseudosulfitobacter koreense]
MTPRPVPSTKKTVLVAGGAGFVGSHLCEALLQQGHRVICLDSFLTGREENILPLCNYRDFRMVRGDVRAPVILRERLERIYNLASPASPPHYQADPIHTMLTNVEGTAGLLDLARDHGARFVQASTSEIYGDPEIHPQPEEYAGHVNCTGPRACYDEGKRAAEALCFDYARAGLDVRVARIFNTYGPRMRPDDGRVVSNFLVQALQGHDITIYGKGQQTRSFCYVSDLVAGLHALMEVAEPPKTAINLGNPEEFTILDLARQVQALVPGQARLVFRPLPQDDPTRRRPDISRARELLGWSPKVTLDQGLPQTAAWFAAAVGAAGVQPGPGAPLSRAQA